MKTLKTTFYWFWHFALPISFAPCIGFIDIVMSPRYSTVARPVAITLKAFVCLLLLAAVLWLVIHDCQTLKELRTQCDIPENPWFTTFESTPYLVLGSLVMMAENIWRPGWLKVAMLFSPFIVSIVSCGFGMFVKYRATPKLIAILESKKEE